MQPISGRGQLRLTRHRNHTGHDDRLLRRAAERGELLRLRSGAYVPAAVWAGLAPDDRRRLEVAAAHDAAPQAFVASHRSAAALWQVPTIRPHDGLVHIRVAVASGTRTEHGQRKHAAHDLDLHLVAVHGIPCTSIERTVLDLAASEPFAEAVVAADWALRHHTDAEALARALDELAPNRGRRRIQSVLDFADPRAESPGESFSRVLIDEAGFPRPQLQAEFTDRDGLIGFVDFYWPEHALIGEFDGAVKYADPAMLRGRTPQQTVVDEKWREDRLRATGPRVTRWIWPLLIRRGALARHLSAAGLPSIPAGGLRA